MEFTTLKQAGQLDEIDRLSNSKLQVLFKHSTRCSISMMAKRVLSREMEQADEAMLDVYFLDLLLHRNLSNANAGRYQVEHESPQLLVIKEGKCVYVAAHGDVSLDRALQALAAKGKE